MKVCSRCSIPKNDNEFTQDKNRVDGIKLLCLKCRNDDYASNPNHKRAFAKKEREAITISGVNQQCTKCLAVKLLTEFSKDKSRKNGLANRCKLCKKEESSGWYLLNKDTAQSYGKNWRTNNIEKKKETNRQWSKNNKEKVRESSKRWAINNPEKAKEAQVKGQKKYLDTHRNEVNGRNRERRALNPEIYRKRCNQSRQNNIEHCRERDRKISAKIRSTPKGALDDRISAGVRASLKGNKKGQKWETLVGYTVDQLKHHIEKQFADGMTWELLMVGEIHIDHKIPKSAFNYEKPTDIDFKRCWALKNLRPMWAFENLSKHNRIDKPFQPSLTI